MGNVAKNIKIENTKIKTQNENYDLAKTWQHSQSINTQYTQIKNTAVDSFFFPVIRPTYTNKMAASKNCSFDFVSLNLDVLSCQTRGKRLGQFVGLFGISDNQGIQVTRASDLELGLGITLADLYQLGITSASLLKEITDICNLLWHFKYYKYTARNKKGNCE